MKTFPMYISKMGLIRLSRVKPIFVPYFIVALFVASFMTACHQKVDGTQEQLAETIDSFAYHYFNYHLPQALRFCTPESEKWLRYMASNVRQADVDVLRAQEEEAEISYDMPETLETDTLALVHLTVNNHFVKDSIGKTGHFAGETRYDILVVKRQGKWVVNLPQQLAPIK